MSGVDVFDWHSLVANVQTAAEASMLPDNEGLQQIRLSHRAPSGPSSVRSNALRGCAAEMARRVLGLWHAAFPRFERHVEVHFVRYKNQGLPRVALNCALLMSAAVGGLYLGRARPLLSDGALQGSLRREATTLEAGSWLLLLLVSWLLWLLVSRLYPLRLLACGCRRLLARFGPTASAAAEGGAPERGSLDRVASTSSLPDEGTPEEGTTQQAVGDQELLRLTLGHADSCFLVAALACTCVLAFTPSRLLVMWRGVDGAAREELQAEYLAEFREGAGAEAASGGGCAAAMVCEETERLQTITLALAFVATYCRLPAPFFLLLVHWGAGWYAFSRAWWGDLYPEWPSRAYWGDLLALYLTLLVLFLGARRTEVQLRAVPVKCPSPCEGHQCVGEALLRRQRRRPSGAARHAPITLLLNHRRADFVTVFELTVQMQAAEQGESDAVHAHMALLRATHDERRALDSQLSGAKLSEQLKRTIIDPDELQLFEQLGKGSFGEVHRAVWRSTPVAVKKLSRHRINEEHLRAFTAECELLLSLRHPHIVQLIGGSWRHDHTDCNVCMVLELCERGTLGCLLRGKLRSMLTWRAHKLGIALGVARALAYLHSQQPPIIHRDLKPENILIDDGFNAKVGDFGVSREAVELTMTQSAGTPLYAAPEILRHERYDESVDAWSFGCCLEVLWTHEHVFARPLALLMRDAGGDPTQARASCAAQLLRLVAEGRLVPSVDEGSFLCQLLAACCRGGSDGRPSFAQLVEQLSAPDLAVEAMLTPPGPPRERDRAAGASSQRDGDGSPSAGGRGSGAAMDERSCSMPLRAASLQQPPWQQARAAEGRTSARASASRRAAPGLIGSLRCSRVSHTVRASSSRLSGATGGMSGAQLDLAHRAASRGSRASERTTQLGRDSSTSQRLSRLTQRRGSHDERTSRLTQRRGSADTVCGEEGSEPSEVGLPAVFRGGSGGAPFSSVVLRLSPMAEPSASPLAPPIAPVAKIAANGAAGAAAAPAAAQSSPTSAAPAATEAAAASDDATADDDAAGTSGDAGGDGGGAPSGGEVVSTEAEGPAPHVRTRKHSVGMLPAV